MKSSAKVILGFIDCTDLCIERSELREDEETIAEEAPLDKGGVAIARGWPRFLLRCVWSWGIGWAAWPSRRILLRRCVLHQDEVHVNFWKKRGGQHEGRVQCRDRLLHLEEESFVYYHLSHCEECSRTLPSW